MNKLAIALALLLPSMCLAQTAKRYGVGLTETGSPKNVHTVFTGPGEDANTTMNVSFATPVGTEATVEVIGGGDTLLFVSNGELCTTFDSIYSKLADGANVYERHVFDKHAIVLDGLTPATDYEFRVLTDSAGVRVSSETHRFKTAGADSWKAAIIGDFHHYSPLWGRLDAAMGMMEVLDSVSGGYDWVLSTGDQCAWGGSYNYWTELAEQPASQNYMWASVQGNHDNMTRIDDRSDAFYCDTHANPLNGYAGQEGVVYWFKYGDALFLMLNNEAMRKKEDLEPVFDWMEKVVQENPAKYVIVVQHYEWLTGRNGTNSQLDRFRDIFDRLGVDLAISGNNHVYWRTPALKDRTPINPTQGTFYVVAPSSDNGRGRDRDPIDNNEDIIACQWTEGPHTVGGMIMDVSPTRIIMTLYDRYGVAHDSFMVPAKR